MSPCSDVEVTPCEDNDTDETDFRIQGNLEPVPEAMPYTLTLTLSNCSSNTNGEPQDGVHCWGNTTGE